MTERRAIFITGGASGIGLATARLFSEKGWLVGVADWNEDSLARARAEFEPDHHVVRLDVRDRAGVTAAVDGFAAKAGGRLDIMHNNAGVGAGGAFEDVSEEDERRLLDVNLWGVINGAHAALPHLKATPGALFFSTSSSSGTYGIPGIAVYSATKHAVRGFSEALSIEWRRHGVRVADVLPGLIDTPLLPPGAAQHAPKEGPTRLIQPREVAEAVWASYHDTSDQLHWFVPAEIAQWDVAARTQTNAMRDAIATGSAFGFGADAGERG